MMPSAHMHMTPRTAPLPGDSARAAAIADNRAYSSGNAPDSFCPKGWRLPSGEGSTVNKSFAYLMATYGYGNDSTGSASARRYPLSLMYSGNYDWSSGGMSSQDARSSWWSHTVYSSTKSDNLLIYSNHIYAQDDGRKELGFSLRCVSL